jgi:hypothetical protein
MSDAYELLAPVYAWFTGGFATKDLEEAAALLRELSGEAHREASDIAATTSGEATGGFLSKGARDEIRPGLGSVRRYCACAAQRPLYPAGCCRSNPGKRA